MKGLQKWLTENVARPAVAGPLGVLLGAALSQLGVPDPLANAIQALVRALFGS